MSIQRERVGRYPTAEKILHYLAEKPGQSRKQITEDLTMSVSVVYWHLIRLEKLHRVLRKNPGVRLRTGSKKKRSAWPITFCILLCRMSGEKRCSRELLSSP